MPFLDIKLVATERRSYLISEPNYHTTKSFTENLLAIEMKKTEILIISLCRTPNPKIK